MNVRFRGLLVPLLAAACGASAAPGPEPVPEPAPAPAPAGCEAARAAFQAEVAAISLACSEDRECALADLHWNPCVPTAARGGQEAALASLLQTRRVAHAACGFVTPPCAAIPSVARCREGRCAAVEGMEPLPR